MTQSREKDFGEYFRKKPTSLSNQKERSYRLVPKSRVVGRVPYRFPLI